MLMKKLYTSILFTAIFSVSMQAQLTLTKIANEPAVGDVQIMVDYDSTVVVPKSTGTGQSWNFMTLTPGTFTETTTYTTVASVPSGSLFPAATIAGVRSNQTEFYQSAGSNFEYVGSYDMSGPSTFSFSNTGILYTWPISMSSTFSDSFAATQTSPSGTMTVTGTVSHTATGTGTVILPNGNTHTNCLQLKEIINLTIVQGTMTINQVENKMIYFSSTTKLPIAEIGYQTQTSGTTTTRSYDFMISKNALSVGIKEQSSVNSNFIVYPNPASDNVNVILPNNEAPSSIEVVDMLGRVVASSTKSTSVITAGLSKGVYTIRVRSKDSVSQKSMVISE